MMMARLRLVLAASLFAAWIGWLVYLATTTTHPVVLSRPQFLDSDLDVIAKVNGDADHPQPTITEVEVVWARSRRDGKLTALTVAGLADLSKKDGWQGPGRYILPLRKTEGEIGTTYKLAGVGSSPGFPSHAAGEGAARLRIYPDRPETREQLQEIRSGHWEQ
jgi:hypothetical protein